MKFIVISYSSKQLNKLFLINTQINLHRSPHWVQHTKQFMQYVRTNISSALKWETSNFDMYDAVFCYFNWLFKELQVVFQWISFIRYGFGAKLDCSKTCSGVALVDFLRSYHATPGVAVYHLMSIVFGCKPVLVMNIQ